jgi:transcriptional regulator with XRE-family HTH domain
MAHQGSVMPTPHRPPLAVRRVLKKLGQDIREARLRRKLPAEIIAERAFTSRPTLRRIEAGDYSVSIGIYASVLQALGLLDGLGELANPLKDEAGMALVSESLPKRARIKRSHPTSKTDKDHDREH